MESILDPKWKCSECGLVHDDEGDAHDCCRPEVTEGYECPLCGAFFEYEEEAFACCGYDPEGPLPLPTREELEDAGQQRLAL